MELEEIKNFLRNKRGYLKEGGRRLKLVLANKGYDTTISNCKKAIREVNSEMKDSTIKVKMKLNKRNEIFINALTDKNPKIDSKIKIQYNNITGKNVLVIGDLHEPFCLNGYLEHCIKTYKQYNCNEVVFIGDIIDNHASSYHETDPDGLNAGEELKQAVKNIQKWYKAFPKAHVIIGNHDRIIMRKAYSSGLSKMWIKDYNEVLGTPGWKFVESIEIDDVLYIHGEGGTARSRIKSDLQSTVQGHLHTQCYVDWIVGNRFKVFGMQVGCGIDHKAYAMAYAKAGKKPVIACGVVLNGKTATNVMMNL